MTAIIAPSLAPLPTGTLNPNHTSTLSANYVSYPTPWPLLLASSLVSAILGHIGWNSAYRSWHPHLDETHLVPQPGTDSYIERSDAHSKRIHPQQYELIGLQTAQRYDPSDDIRPDGGVGYVRMSMTLVGVAWTTLRVFATFALVLSTTLSAKASLPDPWSVVILLIVCQIYLSSRGFPRAINLLMAFNILLMFVAIVLSAWGPRSTSNYYGKVEITGGNCPFFWKNDCPLSGTKVNKNMTVLGCLTNSTWNQAAMGYPREAFFDPGIGPDPNRLTHMYINRMFTRYAGLIIALFTFLWTLYMLLRTRPWTQLTSPLLELRMAAMGTFATRMAFLSYAFMYLFILYALIAHLIDELAPTTFTYIDAFGPPVNTSVFTGTPRSPDWAASHDGASASALFRGGDAHTWSDCFEMTPPKSATGLVAQWWRERESKVLRVLAQL